MSLRLLDPIVSNVSRRVRVCSRWLRGVLESGAGLKHQASACLIRWLLEFLMPCPFPLRSLLYRRDDDGLWSSRISVSSWAPYQVSFSRSPKACVGLPCFGSGTQHIRVIASENVHVSTQMPCCAANTRSTPKLLGSLTKETMT